jgi:hypothetical protein
MCVSLATPSPCLRASLGMKKRMGEHIIPIVLAVSLLGGPEVSMHLIGGACTYYL